MKLTKNEKIIYGIGLGLVALTVYVVINRKRKAKEIKAINDILDSKVADPNAPVGNVIISEDKFKALPDGKFPIKIGEKSKKVYAIQQALNKLYSSNIDLDGVYGESTFQTMCSKIWASGTFGSKEINCIDHAWNDPTLRTRRKITQEDYEKVINKRNN